jgi:hypothetical protein
MAWDAATAQQYTREAERILGSFNVHASNIVNSAPSVVLGLGGARESVEQSKSTIERDISQLQTRARELAAKYTALERASSQAQAEVTMLEAQVSTNKVSVTEAETLAALRKEQAAELQRKGEGNFHSSWLGLWRPLSDQARTGLVIAAVFFGLLAVLGLVMYAKQLFPGGVLAALMGGGSSGSASNLPFGGATVGGGGAARRR